MRDGARRRVWDEHVLGRVGGGVSVSLRGEGRGERGSLGRGGGHYLFNSMYPLPNYHPCILRLSISWFCLTAPIF